MRLAELTLRPLICRLVRLKCIRNLWQLFMLGFPRWIIKHWWHKMIVLGSARVTKKNSLYLTAGGLESPLSSSLSYDPGVTPHIIVLPTCCRAGLDVTPWMRFFFNMLIQMRSCKETLSFNQVVCAFSYV